MRSLILPLALLVLMSACVSTESITVAEMSEDQIYIHDFESRLAQTKMRQKRANARAANAGLVLLGVVTATVDAAVDDKIDHNHDHTLPTQTISLSLRNEGNKSLRLDVVTEQNIDSRTNASVRNIRLERGNKIKVILPYDTFYYLRVEELATGDVRFYDFFSSNTNGYRVRGCQADKY